MIKNAKIVLPTVLLLLLSGCGNPFGASSTGSKYTPTLSKLSLSPRASFCGFEFKISFDYKDPQDDIETVYLLFTGEQNPGQISEEIAWDSTERIDLLSQPGRAIIPYTIDCLTDLQEGRYDLKVWVIDANRHVSNSLTTTFVLQ